jgi:hypothetical protein
VQANPGGGLMGAGGDEDLEFEFLVRGAPHIPASPYPPSSREGPNAMTWLALAVLRVGRGCRPLVHGTMEDRRHLAPVCRGFPVQ